MKKFKVYSVVGAKKGTAQKFIADSDRGGAKKSRKIKGKVFVI